MELYQTTVYTKEHLPNINVKSQLNTKLKTKKMLIFHEKNRGAQALRAIDRSHKVHRVVLKGYFSKWPPGGTNGALWGA